MFFNIGKLALTENLVKSENTSNRGLEEDKTPD